MTALLRRARRWWENADRVVITILVIPVLALLGVIGAGDRHLLRAEHFDTKQVIVAPIGDDGVRITEIIDVDFGRTQRHGYSREVDSDFGVPRDIRSSSTANATLDVDVGRSNTLIRIGSPDETFTGRHRYTLSYTLPDANVSGGVLSLDIVGSGETLKTEQLDIWLTGFELDDIDCDQGRWAAEGGCSFRERDGMAFASIDDLDTGDGVTVNADVLRTSEAVDPPMRDRPAGWSWGWLFALVLLGVCLATLAVIYLFSRWYGTNRVGAADGVGAAFPESDEVARRVPDAELADLAATDFAPPDSMRPWQGALVVNEAIDERSIVAWFSEMIAVGAVEFKAVDGGVASVSRPKATSGAQPDVDDDDRKILDTLFADGDRVYFSRYGTALGNAWRAIARRQERHAVQSGWWHRDTPTYRLQRPQYRPNWSVISFVAALYCVGSLLLFRSLLTPLMPLSFLFSFPVVCIVAAVAATGYSAYRAFAVIRPARTVVGTAAALRVLGFRRFLDQSEARHVEAAWDRDRIREYSAWAVALDTATAWADQVELLPAPAEPLNLDWATALERVVASVDLDSVATYRPTSRGERADPWNALGRGVKWYFENMGSGGGGSGSSRGFSSGSRSSGVGSGGGGGRSGTW